MPVLPFLFTASLLDAAGADLGVDIHCSVWPARSSRNSDVGRHHTHTGEAALEHVDALREPNRQLELGVDAPVSLRGRYRIVGATPMDLVPHVVLELIATHGRS